MDIIHQEINKLPGISNLEKDHLENLMANLTEDQQKHFFVFYGSKRKDPEKIKMLTLLGFIGLAGAQRYYMGEIIMAILYLFTGGLLLIGTIYDLVNYKKITWDYNREYAIAAAERAKQGTQEAESANTMT